MSHARRIPLTAEDRANAPRLKTAHRDVLLAEGSYADIAAAAGLKLGTLKSRLHRARAAAAKLRACSTCQGTNEVWNELLQERRGCPDCGGAQ